MGNNQEYLNQTQNMLAAGAHSKTLIPSPYQSPFSIEPRCNSQSEQAAATSFSPMFTPNAPALPMDLALWGFTTPTPPAPAHVSSPAGEVRCQWIDGTCQSCGTAMTKAAFSRHKKRSCRLRVLEQQFQCPGCPKRSYSRLDALQRHWKQTRCQDLWQAQTPQALNPLDPSRRPILPAQSPVSPASAGSSASHGHIEPQLLPTLYVNHGLYTNPNLIANQNPCANHNPTPRVTGRHDQHGLAPRFLPPQHPLLLYNSTPPSSVAHRESYLRSQPTSPTPKGNFINTSSLQCGCHPDPAIPGPQSGGEQPRLSNSFAPGAPPDEAQPFDIGAPPMTTHNHEQQPMAYGVLATSRANRSQPEADEQEAIEEAFLSAIMAQESCDTIRVQSAPESPGEIYTDDRAATTPDLPPLLCPPQFAPGPLEPRTALIHNPGLELSHGSTLEANISANTGFTSADFWTILYGEHSPLEGTVPPAFEV